MAHRTSSEHSAQRRKLVRRSLQEQRASEVPVYPKSVPYEHATPEAPPRVGTSPAHGKRLRFEPGSEQDAQLQDAVEKRHSRISEEQSHKLNGRDDAPVAPSTITPATSSRHSLSQDQIPARGSSTNWESKEVSPSRISKLPTRHRNPSRATQATGSELPRQSWPPRNELTPDPRALPMDMKQILQDHKSSTPQHITEQQRTVAEPQIPTVHDPYVREKLDLHSSETVEVDSKSASPVVHETIKPHVHHVHHEHITREIHTHDIYKRILPLVEFEVLPAKHFFRTSSGQLVPITEAEVSRLETEVGLISYTITPTVTPSGSKNGIMSVDEAFANLKRFTARSIEPHEREVKRWIDENGVERSEQWHFYKPVIFGARFAEDMKNALPEPGEAKST